MLAKCSDYAKALVILHVQQAFADALGSKCVRVLKIASIMAEYASTCLNVP